VSANSQQTAEHERRHDQPGHVAQLSGQRARQPSAALEQMVIRDEHPECEPKRGRHVTMVAHTRQIGQSALEHALQWALSDAVTRPCGTICQFQLLVCETWFVSRSRMAHGVDRDRRARRPGKRALKAPLLHRYFISAKQ
jgi:hypothetical protein